MAVKREALQDNGVMSVVNDILMSKVLLWRIRKENFLKHSFRFLIQKHKKHKNQVREG